ncbi:MAG: AAA family ATPase [Chloroflexi bacterium]|nr:AAA family ATPase [Chloroflexota bacterium]
MTPVALPSFEIHGFRAFEHLKLEKLGQVNLFVGKNNVGKTSLLEALWVYANQGAPSILLSLLEGRDEGEPISELRPIEEDIKSLMGSVSSLFYGRNLFNADLKNPWLQLGPLDNPAQSLCIKFLWVIETVNDKGTRYTSEAKTLDDLAGALPGLQIGYGESTSIAGFDRLFARSTHAISTKTERKCIFLPASGLSNSEIGRYWDNITLGTLENDVLEALRIVESGIERVNLVGSQNSTHYRERTPIVKLNSFDVPLPLRSLGEGMNHIFSIALALVNAKGGLLLLDEIESGLHYSILPEMWRFIFQAAQRLNVQVFATTHSWDCITGFQQAAQESAQDGMMIRLMNKKGKIIPTFFDEKDLSIATREQIEVR